MKTKIIVVILSISSFTRKTAENIENMTFSSVEDIFNAIAKEQNISSLDKNHMNQISLFEMTDFMDTCNNEYLDLDKNWISYVNLKS